MAAWKDTQRVWGLIAPALTKRVAAPSGWKVGGFLLILAERLADFFENCFAVDCTLPAVRGRLFRIRFQKDRAMQLEWVTILSSAFSVVVGALGGGGVMYFRQNKAAKEIENESNQSNEWRKLYDEMKGELQSKDSKIDKLYEERKRYDDDIAELRKRITDLEISLKSERYFRCEVQDCKNRKPPRFVTTTTDEQ